MPYSQGAQDALLKWVSDLYIFCLHKRGQKREPSMAEKRDDGKKNNMKRNMC